MISEVIASKMECIICQDSGAEPLQDNTACSCKYKRHTTCWIDYVHSATNLKCLMCRKDLSVKAAPKSKSPPIAPVRPLPSIPYTPQHAPVEEIGQQITYQEFLDTVACPPQQQPQQQRQPVIRKPISTSQKLLKIALCLGILAVIVVVFIIFI